MRGILSFAAVLLVVPAIVLALQIHRAGTGIGDPSEYLEIDQPLTLEPGDSALAQLFLQDSIALCEGDRFILRAISPMRTIGGGRILGVASGRHRRFRDWLIEHLDRKDLAIEEQDL